MLSYVISLSERGLARRVTLLPDLREKGYGFSVVDAIDGARFACRDVAGEVLGFSTALAGRVDMPRMTTNELATLESHRKAWRAFLDSGAHEAIIMEDDVKMLVSFEKFSLVIHELRQRVGSFLFIQANVCRTDMRKRRDIGIASELEAAPMGAYCYVVSRQGAQTLLELSARKEIPSDEYMRVLSGKSPGCYHLNNPLADHDYNVPSQIRSRPKGLVLGIGTGRCGTKSLAALWNQQDGCVGYHERIRLPFRPNQGWIEWAKLRFLSEDGTDGARTRLEVGSWYLHYAAMVLDNLPDAKVIAVEREPDAVINSFMRVTAAPYRNHWQPHEGAFGDPHYTCFPDFDPRLSKEKAIWHYINEYRAGVDWLMGTYRGRVLRLPMEMLNHASMKDAVLRWAGITPTNIETTCWI